MGRAIKNINSDHLRVAALRSQGLTHKAIAAETGFSPHHIKSVLSNPTIKELVGEEAITLATGDVMKPEEVLDRVAPKAMQLLEQVITDSDALGDTCPSIKDRINASLEVLGMLGFTKQVKVNHNHTVLKGEDFALIQQKALASMATAEVIDD